MGAEDNCKLRIFLQKFDRALNLLSSFSEKSKASFSENVSFLLDKTLDQLKKLEIEEVQEKNIPEDHIHSALIRSKSIKDFLSETLKVSRAPVIHPPIIIFSIKLVIELTNKESRFQLMFSESSVIFLRIQQLTETTITDNSEVKQTFLSLFLSLAKFEAGQKWLWTSGVLHFITESLADRTIFTRKTAQELINFILPLMNDDQRKGLLTIILEPIIQAGRRLEHHQIVSDSMKPYFEVLESYMEQSLIKNIKDKIGTLLLSMDAERSLLNLAQSAENEKLLTQSGSLLTAIYAKCASEKGADERTLWEEKVLKLIHLVLRRGFLRSTLNVTSQSLYYWSQLNSAENLQIQLVHLMIIPVMMDTEDVAEHFPCYPKLSQFWEEAAQSTTTRAISDALTMMLRTNNELNELTSITLAGFYKSMNKLGKDYALKITRSGLYLLGCLKIPEARRTSQLSFTPQLAIHLTKSLCSFIDVYNIRWWESYETICLPILFTKLISYSASRDTQVTCAGLEGLKFCIQQFIHPDQALLLNGNPESTMNEAADVLQRCSVSVHWEVRDSAMEVILEMTQLSHNRYPEFQNLLIRSGLLMAAMSAFNDTEAYVRSSAIAAVAAATPVPLLWEHLTGHADIINNCYTVLQQDSEALARRAAAKALTLITQSGHFPVDKDRSILYRNMSSAALSDLDWEVKLQALDFWQAVIEDSLTGQGMLDGSFPEYTFSKEKQKIVRLNSAEIRSRLQKSLTELGSCGCLHILLQLVDDCDAPVRGKSIQLLRRLRDLLASHQSLDLQFWPASSHHQVPNKSAGVEQSSNPIEKESGVIRNADDVIDEILSVNDTNLIAGIITMNKEPQHRPSPAPVSSLEAQEFVDKVNLMELENMMESTEMSSDLHVIDFDSLLDDLQDCIHTDPSRPRPDCY